MKVCGLPVSQRSSTINEICPCLPLRGASLIVVEPGNDERGLLHPARCRRQMTDPGLKPRVMQCNLSLSHTRGTAVHHGTRLYAACAATALPPPWANDERTDRAFSEVVVGRMMSTLWEPDQDWPFMQALIAGALATGDKGFSEAGRASGSVRYT